MEKILSNLNDSQKNVVLDIDSNIRIIAGPGSGKTRTITHKIAYLINEKKINPNKVLALAFTNKAVSEMKRRIQSLSDFKINNVFTFHGFCARFLFQEAKHTNLGASFHIIDRNDQVRMLREIYKSYGFTSKTYSYSDVLSYFSKYKNSNLVINDLYENKKTEKIYIEFYEEYTKMKISSNAIDFDDLIIETLKLLESNLEVCEKWSKFFKYIFVDEYQDINSDQYKLLKLIGKNSIINVVGDPDQNIYSWRGAKIDYILNFDKDFVNAKTIILSENYRSNKSIVNVANNLINNNRNRIKKETTAINKDTVKIILYEASNKFDESKWIVNLIKTIKKRNPNYSICVLYRNSYLSAIIEQELLFNGIPYKTVGSLRFAERKEIKEIIFYILFLIKKDDFSFKAIINIPSRKIGPVFISKLEDEKKRQDENLIWNILNNSDNKFVKKNDLLNTLIKSVKSLNKKLEQTKSIDIISDIKTYLKNIGFINFYQYDESRRANINEFLSMLENFVKINLNNIDVKSNKELLIKFINENQLFSSSDIEIKNNNIVLSTMHASKGSEYDVIIISNFNEGVIPSYRCKTTSDFEEERRLAYVSITRAKKQLYFSFNLGLNLSKEENMASTFIGEIKQNINYQHNKKIENDFRLRDNKIRVSDFYSKNILFEGDKIYHDSFGEGIVLESKDDQIIALFKNGEKKQLIKNHIALKRID